MTSPKDVPTAPPPTIAALTRTTILAAAGAGVLLVLFILPAEYGIDPLGTGRRLGLTEIASPTVSNEVAAPAPGAALAPVQNGPIGEYPGEFKFDVFDFVLQPYEYIEYKYQLAEGATMMFAWKAGADVLHDLHAQRVGGTSADGPAEQSFDKRNRRQAAGTYTAPFAGIHGWYWENPGGEPISIHLASAGFYTSAVEIHMNRSRRAHEPRPLDELPASSSPPATAGN